MGRWDSDDEYIEQIIELFGELEESKKDLLCRVAEQMVLDQRKKEIGKEKI